MTIIGLHTSSGGDFTQRVPRDLPPLHPEHEAAEDAAITAILQRYGVAPTT